MLKSIKHSIKQYIYKIVPPPYNNYSYSQAGEDVVIDFLLREINLIRPHYLEIGVYEPKMGNNTYKFYERGARGVLVEADESLISFIQHVRKEDTILNIGVGDGSQKEADFYIFEAKGINTFSSDEALLRQKSGKFKLAKKTRVPLETINEIIYKNFKTYPDFLSIDIEGLDLTVLKTLDFEKYPIPIICAETCEYSENHIRPKNPMISTFLESKGYFIYADTYINSLFVNKKWFNKNQH